MAANSPRIPTGCEKDLYLFTQYSGQCWSDSSIAFLLFSEYIGPRVQEKLLQDQETLNQQFSEFVDSNEGLLNFLTRINIGNPDHILETYSLEGEDKENFIENATTYISCIKKRFENWKRHQEERLQKINRPPLERCESMAFSLCLEAAGAATSELLYPPKPDTLDVISILKGSSFRSNKVTSNNERSIEEKLEEFRGKNIEQRQKFVQEKGKFSSVRGYETARFGRFMALLISFFTDKTVGLIGRDTADNSNGEFWGEGDCTFIFQKSFDILGTKGDLNIDIFNSFDTETLSMSCLVKGSLIGQREGSHAFTFLECGGGFFVYDDNVKVLMPVDWRLLRNSVVSYYIPAQRASGMKSKLISITGSEGKYVKTTWDADYTDTKYGITDNLATIENGLEQEYATAYRIVNFPYITGLTKPGADKIIANRAAAAEKNYPPVVPVMGNAPRIMGGKRRRKTQRRKMLRKKSSRRLIYRK